MTAAAGDDAEPPTKSQVIETLRRIGAPRGHEGPARALIIGQSIRLALYLTGPDESEAVSRALDICARLLDASPEFARFHITDFRLL
ncbi:hypothetical protein GCM10010331_00960 [Streptomyces xanthochromogenes]|uniref:Uncharacterized protein n=1 Tax=Streptomyces xanthochromogenes TaxID=67384 RepID=A0ABQ3A5H6_9ACTN|nr:hypothetical protein GCM10010326_31860 [Streptomyces xanthochromogenes]GHB18941.1 hypothetical protein GCM10010331_00960 [Streptomyces xanthochromogenes]